MAALVESMFSVVETPWHKLGKIVQEAPSTEEAIKLAGLDWTVSKRPVKVVNPDGSETIADGYAAITRDSDDSVFNILGDDYHPLQNSKAFEFFDPFVKSGLAKFETAGSLRDGRTIWVLATLNKAPIEIGKNDAVRKFLLLSNGHDGSMAVRVGFTPIRVVCANTLALSHSAKDSRLLRVFHSRQVESNLDKIQQIVNAADAKFEATAEQYRALAKKRVGKEELKKYVEIVFGFSGVEEERRAVAKERITADIMRLFETGRGSELETAKGTVWGLYNSVSEFLSYERGRVEDSRLNSLWFGDAARINQKAMGAAMELVAA